MRLATMHKCEEKDRVMDGVFEDKTAFSLESHRKWPACKDRNSNEWSVPCCCDPQVVRPQSFSCANALVCVRARACVRIKTVVFPHHALFSENDDTGFIYLFSQKHLYILFLSIFGLN